MAANFEQFRQKVRQAERVKVERFTPEAFRKFDPAFGKPQILFGATVNDKRLIAGLQKISADISLDEPRKALLKAAKIVADKMRLYAPYDPKRKKGVHIKDAIFHAPGKENASEASAWAGVSSKIDLRRQLAVEYGTRRTAASGFARRAVQTSLGPIEASVGAQLKKAIDEIARTSTRHVPIQSGRFVRGGGRAARI